ncbi:MAG: phytanoyl-CoA dioxygenase [Pseudozobellia sp.]|nr:phytanoyl-CoA dioxygenase [Pseudozobellia sp.]|tara:strand:- start:2101 stop:2838 length:738 start_codon:yes stop_codon:yes gene_type:complete
MITDKEKVFLEENGYLNLGQLLTTDEVAALNSRIKELMDAEGENAGSELAESKYIRHPKEEGADRLADLVNKGALFDIFYSHEKVLAAISVVLGDDFKLSSLNYRAAKPGKGLQKLHVDYKNAVAEQGYKVCNSIWLLDDFTNDNGATRIVPGTHKSSRLPDEVLNDPLLPHEKQILINAPAGSVVIFNSHVWHGGTTNNTSKTRRSIHSYFCTIDQPQQIDQKKYITKETRNRLSTKALKVLDV